MPTPETESIDLRAALEAAGCRWTRQRQAVFDHLRAADPHHPTAEEIFRAVQEGLPRISLATVYKALDALEASGLVSRISSADGSARFDARGESHYHIRCLRSGQVQDLDTPFDPDLIAKLDPGLPDRLEREGFHLTGYRLELIGYFTPEPSRVAGGPAADADAGPLAPAGRRD